MTSQHDCYRGFNEIHATRMADPFRPHVKTNASNPPPALLVPGYVPSVTENTFIIDSYNYREVGGYAPTVVNKGSLSLRSLNPTLKLCLPQREKGLSS